MRRGMRGNRAITAHAAVFQNAVSRYSYRNGYGDMGDGTCKASA